MKSKFYLIICMFILFNACSKDNDINHIKSKTGITYQQSLNKLQDFKQSVNNNYSYTVITSSWTGYSTETKLTINKGVVVARDYKQAHVLNGAVAISESWSETASDLNTHKNGATTLTLDEVYTKASNEWLKADTKTNTIDFETENNGLISACGYTPNNCVDDCFFGITISNIAGL